MRRHFYAVHLYGRIPEVHPEEAILLLPNHSSWWDGFFIYLLNKACFHRRVWLMMLESQLKQNKFFSRLGAFSINKSTPGHIRESISYAAKILQKPGSILCLFPQGELLPWGKRPVRYKKGLSLVTKKANCAYTVVLLAMKIEFLQQQRPEVFLLPGPAVHVGENENLELSLCEELETKLLDDLKQRIMNNEKSATVFRGGRSINEKISALKKKMTLT